MPYKARSHIPAGKPTERQRRKEQDANRPSAHKRGYDKNWRKLRGMVLARNPLCQHCLRDGRTTIASEVDHIKPHKGNPALFFDMDNLQSLCKPCHSRKTATEDSTFAKADATRSDFNTVVMGQD